MRLYKQKDISKQHRNSPDGPPRATSASPDGKLPQRLKRAAEAVSRQIAGHKAMISQFNDSKPSRQPVIDNPPPLKRSNAVKGSVKPPVVPRKADVPKALASLTGSKKQFAPSSTSPKSRSPPAPPGLGTKKATPQRAKSVLTTLTAPIKPKPQSPSSQTRSPVQKTGTESLASPTERTATPANLPSVTLTSIPEQDASDELLLPVSCFRAFAEDSDLEEDWLDDEVELTSDFNTQITQVFSFGLGPQSKDDVVRHGEIAPPLITPGTTLTQTLEPMSVLVENWVEPIITIASSSDGFETIPLHLTDCVPNDTPDIASIPSVQPTPSASSPPSPIYLVSPIVSSDIALQKSLSCQPHSSTDYDIPSVQPTPSAFSASSPSSASFAPSPIYPVSPIVSPDLVLQKSLSCQPLSSTDYDIPSVQPTPSASSASSPPSPIYPVSPIVSSDLVLQKSLSCQPPSSTDYEFVSYLGNGAFGAVLLGIHKQNQRSCAIKIMSKATIEEQDIVHAVLAEQRAMRQASGHPYLLGLLASFHDADNFYLVSVSIHSPHLMTESSFWVFRNTASLRCSKFKCSKATRSLRLPNWYLSSLVGKDAH